MFFYHINRLYFHPFLFSINLITLLALILCTGLVVDDSIVMLENIHRKIEEGEKPLKAAIFGSKEVFFAIVSTSIVLISVFLPIIFLKGDTARHSYNRGVKVFNAKDRNRVAYFENQKGRITVV